MCKTEIMEKMQETIKNLYQNREKAALQGVSELLLIFQNMLDYFISEENDIISDVMNMLKKLIDCYNHIDMYGMADCLQEKAYDVIELYFKRK